MKKRLTFYFGIFTSTRLNHYHYFYGNKCIGHNQYILSLPIRITLLGRKDTFIDMGPNSIQQMSILTSPHTRSSCIHYGRYKNHSLIAFGGTRYFAIKWIYSILILVESHCHYQTESNQMCIKLLSNGCVSLLGYTLGVQSLTKKVRVGATEESHICLSGAKILLSKVPILLLVKLMAKENFRDSTGRPISKLAWTTSTDDEILNRFVQTWRIFSLYHSGSINRDGLRRLRYILQFSCDNTLACKHKSATRSLCNVDLIQKYY